MAETPEELFARASGHLRRPPLEDWVTFPFEGEIRVRELLAPIAEEPPRAGEGGSSCWRCENDDSDAIWSMARDGMHRRKAGSTISIDAQSYPGEIRIAVRDEGVGLSERDRKEMFERFYRGARTRDTTPGSGLGLWIARAFVVACNGRLEAVSGGASQGTTVTIVLPETEAPAALEHGRLDD